MCVYKHWKCKCTVSEWAGSTVHHGSMNQMIWICYLLFGWSEDISMPASFLSLSNFSFSFKHIHVIHNMHGHVCKPTQHCIFDAWTCQCIMNFNFSFLKETLYADISVIECSLKDSLSVKCWCNIFFYQFLVSFHIISNNLACQIFLGVS